MIESSSKKKLPTLEQPGINKLQHLAKMKQNTKQTCPRNYVVNYVVCLVEKDAVWQPTAMLQLAIFNNNFNHCAFWGLRFCAFFLPSKR